jgi:hypothetical protein
VANLSFGLVLEALENLLALVATPVMVMEAVMGYYEPKGLRVRFWERDYGMQTVTHFALKNLPRF